MKKRGLKLAAVIMALALVPAAAFAAGPSKTGVADRDSSNTTSTTDNTFSGGTSSTGTVSQGNGTVTPTTPATTPTTPTESTTTAPSRTAQVITAGDGTMTTATGVVTKTTAASGTITTGSVITTTGNGSKVTDAGDGAVNVEYNGVETKIAVVADTADNTAQVSTDLSTLRQAVTAGTSTDAATAAVKAEGFQSTGVTTSLFMTDATSGVEVTAAQGRIVEYPYLCSGLRADAEVRVVFVNNDGTTQVLNVRRDGDILYFVLPASGQITVYIK